MCTLWIAGSCPNLNHGVPAYVSADNATHLRRPDAFLGAPRSNGRRSAAKRTEAQSGASSAQEFPTQLYGTTRSFLEAVL
jgi:hypothetical protein